jgi:hypothetical protein
MNTNTYPLPRPNGRNPRRSRRERNTTDCPYSIDDPRAAGWYRQQARRHSFDAIEQLAYDTYRDDDYAPYARRVGVDRNI